MGATEMTATGSAFAGNRLVATFVGLLVACAMLLGISAKSADAAVVGNPGTFTATFNSGSMQYGNQNFPTTGSFTMNVAANGNFTVDSITYPGINAPNVNHNSNVRMEGVVLTPQTTGTWSGNINPATGTISMSGPQRIWLTTARYGYFPTTNNTETNGSCPASQPVTVSPSGSNYSFHNGGASLSFGPFTGGGALGGNSGGTCRARSGLVGGSTADLSGSINNTYGMNGSSNTMNWNLTIRDGSDQPIKPPVVARITASHAVAATDEAVTLNAGSSEIFGSLAACSDPSPAEPACGYRWDFNGDGNIDEVTNVPTTNHVYTAAGVHTTRVTIFNSDGDSGNAQVQVESQDRPIAQINTTPPSVTKETTNAFSFSIPANPYSATTECSVDGAPFSDCSSGSTFNFVQADDTTGSHNFRVRAVTPGDVVGPSDQYNFTIDRVKPRVTVNTFPVNPTNATSASFTFTADKAGSTLECQLDGGSWDPCGTNSSGSRSYSSLTQSSGTPIEAPNPHEFRVRATDSLGNIGGGGNPGGGGYDWDIDLTSPVSSFTTKPANPSSDVSPVFVWNSNEAIQLAQCRLAINGTQGAWQNCGSLTTKSYSNLADGSYVLGVRTLDIAGNWSNVLSHSWLIETVTPPLQITSTPVKFSNRTSAQFLFNTEPGATTTCQLDSRPVQDPCPSGVKYSYLAAGTHIFSVTATDPALNQTTQTYTWTVKTAKPAVQIEAASLPAASSTSSAADFDLTTANGVAECRLDGAAWSDCDSDASQAYSGLADGKHTFEVRAGDEYSNVSAVDGYSWLVVANAPVVSFGQTPDANTNKSTGMFTFAVNTADDDVNTSCSLDGNVAVDCGSPAAVTQLADGSHTFEVTATDTAGQVDTASYTWSVKAKIPGLGFDSNPAALSNSTSANFAFSSDEDPDVTYECRTDSGSFSACTSPVNLSGLSQGDHSFTVRATDSVGNRATEAYLWRVDSIAPTVTINQKPAATTQKVAELISFSGSESGVSFECKLDSGSFAACTSPTLVKNLGVGVHTFTVRAKDAAGNVGPESSTAWTIQAPTPVGPQASKPVPAASAPAVKAPVAKAPAKQAKKKATAKGKKAAKKKQKNALKKKSKKSKKSKSKPRNRG